MVLSSDAIFLDLAGSAACVFLLSAGCIKTVDRKDFAVTVFLSDVVAE